MGIVKNMTLLPLIAASMMLFSASAPIYAGGIRIGDTPARRIAKDSTVPGKNVEGQCLPFANALHAKFQAAGIPSQVVSFQYETLAAPREILGEQRAVAPINERGGLTGAHAVVIYEDDGRIYVMDNQSWQPKWIHEASTIDMARQFAGMDIAVGEARVLGTAGHATARGGRTAPAVRAQRPLLAGK